MKPNFINANAVACVMRWLALLIVLIWSAQMIQKIGPNHRADCPASRLLAHLVLGGKLDPNTISAALTELAHGEDHWTGDHHVCEVLSHRELVAWLGFLAGHYSPEIGQRPKLRPKMIARDGPDSPRLAWPPLADYPRDEPPKP